MFSFQKLEVWQMAKKMVVEVYKMTQTFPSGERFGLTSQINRSAVSVASNIAEGSGRTSYKDQAHFTETAYGSLMEMACQIEITIVNDLNKLTSHRGRGDFSRPLMGG